MVLVRACMGLVLVVLDRPAPRTAGGLGAAGTHIPLIPHAHARHDTATSQQSCGLGWCSAQDQLILARRLALRLPRLELNALVLSHRRLARTAPPGGLHRISRIVRMRDGAVLHTCDWPIEAASNSTPPHQGGWLGWPTHPRAETPHGSCQDRCQ